VIGSTRASDDAMTTTVQPTTVQPTTCPACGLDLRPDDDAIVVDHRRFHVDCAEAHREPRRRRLSGWSIFGSSGQMAMNEPQRG